ncbi:MAG: ABC transporter permease [Anaerolineae bacterium]|jgi:simple sugar transport system permease protein|nr:ABC transporter permease [Anaerolineae bacterium]
MATTTGKADERLSAASPVVRLLRRPEVGAIAGTIVVWLFFALTAGERGFLSLRGTANYLEVAAQYGILALAVCLLMIGGQFDLSVGSVIGAAGMITALLSVHYGWNIWAALVVSLAVSLLIGAVNGLLVVRTKLPSFIITLASLFIVRGATIGITRLVTGRTQVGGLGDVAGYETAFGLFASNIPVAEAQFSLAIVWWLALAGVATYVLLYTRPGNWIFGIGGDEKAALNVGVPVDRMKIVLFMTTAGAAWLVATIQILDSRSADVLRGEQREFFAIIAAVIGGTLLTGGYGSVIGAVFGALILGMVQQGIVFTGVDSDWFLVFLGAMLIIAVLVNNYIRRRASEAK